MSRLSLTARVLAIVLTLATVAACSTPTGPSTKTSQDQSNPHI